MISEESRFDAIIKDGPGTGDVFEAMDKYKIMAQDIASREAGDFVDRVRQEEEKLTKDHSLSHGTFYRDLVYSVVNIRLSEKQARKDWEEILVNKYYMSEKLHRNVGVYVAALDYYTNIKKRLINPTVVNVEQYLDTVNNSYSDRLTKVGNRRYFDLMLEREFQRVGQFAQGLSVLFVDVDNFKQYNDSEGHLAGDLLLMGISRIFNALTRDKDTVARYGGEEFAIIFPDTNDLTAENIANEIRKTVAETIFQGTEKMEKRRNTISGGVAAYHPQMQSPLDLIQACDTALYQAKREGKDRIINFSKINPI